MHRGKFTKKNLGYVDDEVLKKLRGYLTIFKLQRGEDVRQEKHGAVEVISISACSTGLIGAVLG